MSSTPGNAPSKATNPRGIPEAPFIDRVEDVISSRDQVEDTLRNFQEMISCVLRLFVPFSSACPPRASFVLAASNATKDLHPLPVSYTTEMKRDACRCLTGEIEAALMTREKKIPIHGTQHATKSDGAQRESAGDAKVSRDGSVPEDDFGIYLASRCRCRCCSSILCLDYLYVSHVISAPLSTGAQSGRSAATRSG